ncbi:MAG TPA: hypothetical protein VK483_15250 [Chitinophagaceae bacterium]|nr:hypothetical protein [Chitinophagaceae bacterium]
MPSPKFTPSPKLISQLPTLGSLTPLSSLKIAGLPPLIFSTRASPGLGIAPLGAVKIGQGIYDSSIAASASTQMPSYEKNFVFVIMSLDSKRTYETIKEGCKKIGLNALRSDEIIGSGSIMNEVINAIKLAEFIICDLTYERPNVYYELGYAHALGNGGLNLLLIAKKNTILHYDIRSLRVHDYSSAKGLKSLIGRELKKMKSESRKRKILRKKPNKKSNKKK